MRRKWMRVIKKVGMLLMALCVLLVVIGNTASISNAIWEIMNAFMPIAIVLIGIGFVIQSIFK